MWPDNETTIDCLDSGHLVGAVTGILRNHQLLPTTIGVYGDWGSGKSSLIRMVEEDLKADEGVLCLRFNGWLFEGYQDAKTALMGTILDEIANRRTLGERSKQLLTNLLKRVDWLRLASVGTKGALAFLLGGPAGLGVAAGSGLLSLAKEAAVDKAKDATEDDIAKVAGLVGEAWKGEEVRKNIRSFHDDFGELLNQTDVKTLVVFIDDLDRCTPDTIIETLEAIRLFLFVPGTAFVLGADERLVRYAVRRRFPELPGERVEVGRDYLEKMVQFPVRVPALGPCELETYINLLFASLTLPAEGFEKARTSAIHREANELQTVSFNYGVAQQLFDSVPAKLAEGLTLAQRLAPVLAVGLNGNPRQCKRFLNTLLIRASMAASRKTELQLTVLAKLMLLEYFRPEWFRRLAEIQASQDGEPEQLRRLEELVSEHKVADPAPPGRESQSTAEEKKGGRASGLEAQSEAPIEEEFRTWALDSWMRDWLGSEPKLTGLDLRPYFYFSRDSLEPLSGVTRRMTPVAQELLTKLLSQSEAVRGSALRSARSLGPGDAAAVFEAVADKVRREEDLGAEDSSFGRLFDWASARPELKNQLVSLLGRLPEATLPATAVLKLVAITEGDTQLATSAASLLRRWAESSLNPSLAKAATYRSQPRPGK